MDLGQIVTVDVFDADWPAISMQIVIQVARHCPFVQAGSGSAAIDIARAASGNCTMLNRCFAVAIVVLLHACATPSQRIDSIASKAALARSVVTGTGYRHVVYANARAAAAGDNLIVYLEGDGRPWQGTRPADDPTTGRPIALQLLGETSFPAIYVSRPCYQQMQDPPCTSSSWTDGRYSQAIVASMAAAIDKLAGGRKVTLVGYSGGGVLAVLLAETLADVRGVITIGANLDTDAWTAKRDFLPLAGSINPALSAHDHPWPEVHFQGELDIVVPPSTADRYFVRYPAARREQVGEFDHVCCWVERWRTLLPEVLKTIEMAESRGDDLGS